MKIDNFVINKLTFIKVVFSFFYAVFVYTESDKLLLPIFMAFLLLLLDIKTSVLGIIGLGSLLYLIFTGLYHFDKSWNHRWTIACTSVLVFSTVVTIYYNITYGSSPIVYIFTALALLMATFVIYGSILGLRILKSTNS